MSEQIKNENEHISASTELGDVQRVKVLSPGMLVAKRFFRNKLAMVGLIIIVTMFLFSFVGGFLTPYGESEVFRTTDEILKDYAGVTLNKDFEYTAVEGLEFPAAAGSKLILATNRGEDSFEVNGNTYSLVKEGEDFYQIGGSVQVAKAVSIKGNHSVTSTSDLVVTDSFKKAFSDAVASEQASFDVDGITYMIQKQGKETMISTLDTIALASKMIFSPYEKEQELSYHFRLEAERALQAGKTAFEADGNAYELKVDTQTDSAMVMLNGKEYALLSHYAVRSATKGSFLSIDFKKKVEEAVAAGEKEIAFTDQSGKETEYVIQRKDNQYMVRSEKTTQVNDTFAAPGKEHWLGTDQNGMDILTRLMYGGRISLLIGFVAIAIELLIGIIIGGVAGYFGNWIDNLLMRLVDIVNCIPAMPLYIIIGAIMDYYQIDPRLRLYVMCMIIGFLSWPKVARMVRGQILSLKEQEFMIATEATGVRISRRIFRHLVPNVIPQLIVIATMGLGEIIIMEATLSFLGLGVKFPFASWGSIVNAVNDIYVLTNYWFVWIPAGFLILITVLGFNFVGDGLRDAFDPKMKR